ncbi:peptidase M4 thermolysin [Fusarium austroafricanum]|uniref:Peptidase M4 thermolysin n=1 Tax=Fusarium austroafricanum TaxID=2364996 RepID=A0A8H4NUA6_9HYPO|nr:peptidase M4 thermolysin [Fusarium austroafricanum]
MCHFVPGYVLQKIAESEAIPEEARQAAIRTLSVDQDFREQRVQALTRGEATTAPVDSDIPAAQAPIVRSGFVPPGILEHVAQSELLDDETRENARVTLRSDAKIREQRAALVGPAATDQPHDPAAVALVLRRAIYDGRNRSALPGTLTRAEGALRTRDRQVNNVFDGVGITVKFFHTVFGRNAIDGNGGTPRVTVHHNPDPETLGYNNAFWNSDQLVFGDGDGITFDYFADSLDVVAHELTHAITEHSAGIPYSKQAGGLNESISDIFAALVEQWHFNQTAADADWLTGQNLFPIAFKGAALRNIANPGTAFNDPILGQDAQIDHFSKYNDSLDVHITSGIPNRAFYLIAINFGGHAWLKAGKIWYETLKDPEVRRFGQDITFKNWADVTVNQADKLFGVPASIVVRNAWVSVGVLI